MSYIPINVPSRKMCALLLFLHVMFWIFFPPFSIIFGCITLCLFISRYVWLIHNIGSEIKGHNNYCIEYDLRSLLMTIKNSDNQEIIACYTHVGIMCYCLIWFCFCFTINVLQKQITDHSTYLVNTLRMNKQIFDTKMDNKYSMEHCPICHENFNTNVCILPCKHLFCCVCFCEQYVNRTKGLHCLLCIKEFEFANCAIGTTICTPQ